MRGVYMVTLIFSAAIFASYVPQSVKADTSACTVTSVTSYEQAGGMTAGCIINIPTPPPKIAKAFIGHWEGQNACKLGSDRIAWDISQGEDGQIQVQETYTRSGFGIKSGSVLYDAHWSAPLLILTAFGKIDYRIVVKLDDPVNMSGRYFHHYNCQQIYLKKTTDTY
jgi:hypothetical protein